MDVNRDGVLAAASARKLDKGGYSLQEHAAVALCSQDPGLLDVDKALAELLCDGSSVLAASSKSHETAQVEAWISKFFRGGVADILEVSWGAPVVSEAARLRGYRVPPCFTHLALSYGIAWDLEQDSHLQAISSAIDLFNPRVLVVNFMRKDIPEALLRLTLQSASLARGGRFHVAVHLSGQEGLWGPWGLDAWRAEFGTLADPRFPWSFVRADACQFLRADGRGTPIVEGSMFWLSDLDLSKVGLRCSKPDALGVCAHRHAKGRVKDYNLAGAAFCISLEDSGLRGAVEYSVAPVNTYSSTEAGTPSAPAVRAAPAPAPVMPLPDVKSGEDLSPESVPNWSAKSTSTPRRWMLTGSPKRTRGTGIQFALIWKCTRLRVERSRKTPAGLKRTETLFGTVSRSLRVLPGRASLKQMSLLSRRAKDSHTTVSLLDPLCPPNRIA